MRRVRRGSRTTVSVLDGPCGCWAHDHPHPGHTRADRIDAEGRLYRPDEQPPRLAAVAAGCTTCSIVAGGTYLEYLARMGRR